MHPIFVLNLVGKTLTICSNQGITWKTKTIKNKNVKCAIHSNFQEIITFIHQYITSLFTLQMTATIFQIYTFIVHGIESISLHLNLTGNCCLHVRMCLIVSNIGSNISSRTHSESSCMGGVVILIYEAQWNSIQKRVVVY